MEEERLNTKEKLQCAAEFWITEGERRHVEPEAAILGVLLLQPSPATCKQECAEQPRVAGNSPCSFLQEEQCC